MVDLEIDGFPEKVAKFVLSKRFGNINELSVLNISEFFRVKRSYLLVKFKKEQDVSLCKFILRYKLQIAISKLENDDISIQELSEKLGFQKVGVFNQVFKEHLAVKPALYRIFTKAKPRRD
jgi:AraC-like DNA-binding protein